MLKTCMNAKNKKINEWLKSNINAKNKQITDCLEESLIESTY